MSIARNKNSRICHAMAAIEKIMIIQINEKKNTKQKKGIQSSMRRRKKTVFCIRRAPLMNSPTKSSQ